MKNITEDYLEERIKKIFYDFLKMKKLIDGPSLEKKKLKSLITYTDKLRNHLNDLNSIESGWLGKNEVLEDEQNNPLKWLTTNNNKEELKALEDYLCNIKLRAERALGFFKSKKGGRPEDIVLKYFIRRMAWLWEEVKGKKPSKTYPTENSKSENAFLVWVNESLENLGHPPYSKQSLAGHIKRALS